MKRYSIKELHGKISAQFLNLLVMEDSSSENYTKRTKLKKE